jgi:hypothetical protein
VSGSDGDEINAIVQDALRDGHAPDPDKLRAAQDRLSAKIRAQVARELENAGLGDKNSDNVR